MQNYQLCPIQSSWTNKKSSWGARERACLLARFWMVRIIKWIPFYKIVKVNFFWDIYKFFLSIVADQKRRFKTMTHSLWAKMNQYWWDHQKKLMFFEKLIKRPRQCTNHYVFLETKLYFKGFNPSSSRSQLGTLERHCLGRIFCDFTKKTKFIHTSFCYKLWKEKVFIWALPVLLFEQRFESWHLHFCYNTWR